MTRSGIDANRRAARLGRGHVLAIWAISAVAVTVTTLTAPAAHAWMKPEHVRHPDQAYQIMKLLRMNMDGFYAAQAGRPLLSQCPASICTPTACPNGCAGCSACAAWNAFIADVRETPPILDSLRSDLTDVPAGLAAGTECANRLPNLAPGVLATCRAADVPFPPDMFWGLHGNECSVRPRYVYGGADQNETAVTGEAPFFHALPSNFTGAVLGHWTTRPDTQPNELRLWIRPSHLGMHGQLIGIAETAATVGLALAIAPVACIANIIFGGGDCISDAIELSSNVNLISMADEQIGMAELYTFGQKTFSDTDFPLNEIPYQFSLGASFHFANVGSFSNLTQVLSPRFNKMPGTNLFAGGAFAVPPTVPTIPQIDPLDLGLVAACDVLGATVHPFDSNGVVNYAPFADGALRTVGDWINPTYGHVEFEPVQNLGAYGWSNFLNGVPGFPKGGARGLGWVLHAIGDAGMPHHTISAYGWGHDPFETYAQLSWHDNFHEADVIAHYPDLEKILVYAFEAWTFLGSNGGTNLPVRDFIQQIAIKTFGLPVSVIGRAYIPTNLFYPPVSNAFKAFDVDVARDIYAQEAPAMKDLQMRVIGNSLGFLTRASNVVPPDAVSVSCACTSGAKVGQDAAGKLVYNTIDRLCRPCGQPPFQDLPLLVDGKCFAVCPPDRPTPNGTGGCTTTGSNCPAGQFVLPNGTCAATCAPPRVAVQNRLCVNGPCPAGTSLVAPNVCVPIPPAPPSGCGVGASDDNSCRFNSDCCSNSCLLPQHVCRSTTGGPCFNNERCATGTCVIPPGAVTGTCIQSGSGGACGVNADCLNGNCTPSGHCGGFPGDSCEVNGDCMIGSECVEGPLGGQNCCIPSGLPCNTGGSSCCFECDQTSGLCTIPL